MSSKAIALLKEMADSFLKRETTKGMAQTLGSNSGNPTLLLGGTATTVPGAFIEIKSVESLQLNGIGQSQEVYTPHKVQVVMEVTANDSPDTYNTLGVNLDILGECVMRGLTVEVYTVATGNAPSHAGITGTPKGVFKPSVYYPLSGQ